MSHPQFRPVNLVAIAAQYQGISQAYAQRDIEISAELQDATTVQQREVTYVNAAAAEHDLNTKLLALPLFPTALRDDWKGLMMANRRLEDLYTQLSLISAVSDGHDLAGSLSAAKTQQASAENQFRKDLLLPNSSSSPR